MAALLLAPGAVDAGDDGVCGPVRDVPVLGPACWDAQEGLWTLELEDGTLVRTHGPDPVLDLHGTPSAEARGGSDHGGGGDHSHVNEGYTALTRSDRPACVDDPSTAYHNRLLYVRSEGTPSRFQELGDDIVERVHHVNGMLRREARGLGWIQEYRFRCEAGAVAIDEVVVPTPNEDISFWGLVNDLRDQGFDSQLVKYWIWYDDRDGVVNWGGTATLHGDDRLAEDNRNNRGPDYAVTWGTLSAGTMMHESGHNLGAVQPSAPHFYHNRGGRHCYDEQDIMCYGEDTKPICPGAREIYDCNHDDYYHPDPPKGSYLDTHWNVGSHLNRFLTRQRCPGPLHAASDAAGASLPAPHCEAAVAADGEAEGGLLAASAGGPADGIVALSGSDEASGTLAASGQGEATGNVAGVSLVGDARGPAAASGTGEAEGIVAVSGTGAARGTAPVGAGACNGTPCFDGAPEGQATGHWLAAGGDGARCVGAPACAAVAGTGAAEGPVAASGLGPARGSVLGASLGGDATGEAAASGAGEADGANAAVGGGGASAPYAVAVDGPAAGTWAASGFGPAEGFWLGASGTGDASATWLAVSGTGDAEGGIVGVSGCETGRSLGVSAVCGDPAAALGPVLP